MSKNRVFSLFKRCIAQTLSLGVIFAAIPLHAVAAPDAAAASRISIQDFKQIGKGRLKAYTKGSQTLVSLPIDAFRQPVLWYAEAVALPPGVVTEDLEAASKIVQFERRDNQVVIRDMTSKINRRTSSEQADSESTSGMPAHRSPISQALDMTTSGPILATLPVLAQTQDGGTLVDISRLFSGEIAGFNARSFISLTKKTPAGLDPEKSYIDKVRVFEDTLNVHSQLTYQTIDPKDPQSGPVPASLIMGYSWILLPSKPMAQRLFDPRVGFFTSSFVEYEPQSGGAAESKELINRFRLEKKDPTARVSDPIKPITFYIGPGVPERWRPYIKAGIEQWNPVLESAGFSNAIRVLNAPTPAEDPNWSADNLGINVVRWLPQEHANAYGPHVIDPRSGETLAAHIVIWPSVLDWFSKYYFTMFSSVDPEASKYPLPEQKIGKLLAYIVGHEMGHSLGLRHNHIASTAYSVEQMRNAQFANQHGPNSSIMAYGRFNYVAQPGDGVKQLYSVLGPYDYAAIKWGYAKFGTDAASEQQGLQQAAKAFTEDRNLYWGAGELPTEQDSGYFDPRIQKENVGRERIAATRFGIANIVRTVQQLDQKTLGNDPLLKDLYEGSLSHHISTLASVIKMLGGSEPVFDQPGQIRHLTAKEQQEAVDYLLGEGLNSLNAYLNPKLLNRLGVVGSTKTLQNNMNALMSMLLDGFILGTLEEQFQLNPEAYGPVNLGQDIAERVWSDLNPKPMQKMLQEAYVAQTAELVKRWPGASEEEKMLVKMLQGLGYPGNFAQMRVESGDDTSYAPWLREYLPQLKKRLDEAMSKTGDVSTRYHLAQMSQQVSKLLMMAQ